MKKHIDPYKIMEIGDHLGRGQAPIQNQDHLSSELSLWVTAPVGKNVYQVAQNVYLKMYAKTRPGTGTQRMSMSPGMLGERYLMNQCAS